MFAEYAAEVGRITETDLFGNRTDAVGRGSEQVLGLEHPITIEILPERNTKFAIKNTRQVVFANADSPCNFPTRKWTGVVLVQVGDCAFDQGAGLLREGFTAKQGAVERGNGLRI